MKASCELCGRDTSEIFSSRDYRRPFDRTEYSVRWCDQCALGRLAGSFSPEDIIRFFDIPYYTHGETKKAAAQHLETSQRPRVNLLDRLITHLAWRVDRGADLTPDELGSANNRTLCDLGCGDGSNLRRFRDAGFKVVGVEPDPIARARARRFADVFDGTIETLPEEIASQCFDVLLLSHVFDVCTDIGKATSNLHKILAPRGVLVIEVANFAAMGFQIYGPEWPWADIPRHLTFLTEKSLRRILDVGGFSVRRVQYVGYTRQFLRSWKDRQEIIRREIGDENSHIIPSFLWLLRTALASPARKYDSVRVLATLTH